MYIMSVWDFEIWIPSNSAVSSADSPLVFGSESFWSIKGDVGLQEQRQVGHINSLWLQQLQSHSLSLICTNTHSQYEVWCSLLLVQTAKAWHLVVASGEIIWVLEPRDIHWHPRPANRIRSDQTDHVIIGIFLTLARDLWLCWPKSCCWDGHSVLCWLHF